MRSMPPLSTASQNAGTAEGQGHRIDRITSAGSNDTLERISGSDILAGLERRTPREVPIAGAMAGDDLFFQKPPVIRAF